MKHPPRERIVLVGPGRTGCSLVRLWQRNGHEVVGLVGGSAPSLDAARIVLGPIPDRRHADALNDATLVVVGVSDDHLDEAIEALGKGPPVTTDPPLAIHLAGSRGREALLPLSRRGLRLGAMHPLRAFPSRDPGTTDLGGCACALDAEPEHLPRLTRLVKEIGGCPFELRTADRALYHAGAALAGNAVLAVFDAAERAFQKAGVPKNLARSALASLSQGALGNAAREGGAAGVLTGPVVRGDRAVIVRHLEALARLSSDDVELYVTLARALVRLSASRPDGGKASQIKDLLEEGPA